MDGTGGKRVKELNYFCIETMETRGFFQLEIIIKVSSSRIIWITMLWPIRPLQNSFTLTVRGYTLYVRI